MTTYTVKFLPYDIISEIEDGDTVIRAALEAGVHVNASCGGEGVCGKCRVMIEEGVVEGGISEKLSAEDQEKGYRLACQAVVKSDLAVRIPVESTIDAGVLKMQAAPRRTILCVKIEPKGRHGRAAPWGHSRLASPYE